MASKSIKRISKDIKLYHTSNINEHGIYVYFNDKNIFSAKALIMGPKDTPYQNGFYLFDIIYPESYPQHPPKVKLQTLNSHTRFNPNLYTDGKVCLSILGTWSGPGWTPCLSTNEVLLSIQSLMNNNPIQNEPGYEKLTLQNSADARNYVDILTYHNHKFAVIQTMDKIPHGFECFKEIIHQKFIELYDENIANLKQNLEYITKNPKLKQLKLRMYNLYAQPDYKELIKTYDSYFTLINKISYGKVSNSANNNVLCDESKGSDTESTQTSQKKEVKKRIPNQVAANHDEGFITTSTNDNREYMVKIVKGRGGSEHKRWVLVK